jgi:hypothetical protein
VHVMRGNGREIRNLGQRVSGGDPCLHLLTNLLSEIESLELIEKRFKLQRIDFLSYQWVLGHS